MRSLLDLKKQRTRVRLFFTSFQTRYCGSWLGHQSVDPGQDLARLALQVDVGDVISVSGRLQIDLDDFGAMALGNARDHVGWTDLARGADDDKSVAALGRMDGAVIGFLGDAFAKKDEVRLQQTSAARAVGRFFGHRDARGRELLATFAAYETRHVAMELVDVLIARNRM